MVMPLIEKPRETPELRWRAGLFELPYFKLIGGSSPDNQKIQGRPWLYIFG
jgi:hypothetical protein